MQSPSSFHAACAILEPELEAEFDAEAMLEQLASQKETAARVPFMAPAFIREQISRMEWRQSALKEVEVCDSNRFKVSHDSQEMTGAMPIFRKSANISRSKIDPVSVLRRSPNHCPKERYKGLPEKRSDLRECVDYASLNDMLAEIQLKQLGIAYFEPEPADQEEMACRFSTNLPKMARNTRDNLVETFHGCIAVIKVLFFGASLGFTEQSN